MLAVAGANATNMKTIYNYKNLKNDFPREVLEKLLLEENYTYRDLQQLYHYDERLWSKLAQEYSIPKQMRNIRSNANKYHKININEDELLRLYVDEKYSLRQLANTFHCNRDVIKVHLKQLNVNIRPFNDANYYKNRNIPNPAHQCIDASGYIIQMSNRQHRAVMEQYLGRKLTPDEHVHHIDLDKTNNNIDNLFLFPDDIAHLSYHGYIRHNKYIHPQEFIDKIYPMIIRYKSKEFLYYQYVISNKSVSQIAQEIDYLVSRQTLTKLLKEYGLFTEGKHINQYKQQMV